MNRKKPGPLRRETGLFIAKKARELKEAVSEAAAKSATTIQTSYANIKRNKCGTSSETTANFHAIKSRFTEEANLPASPFKNLVNRSAVAMANGSNQSACLAALPQLGERSAQIRSHFLNPFHRKKIFMSAMVSAVMSATVSGYKNSLSALTQTANLCFCRHIDPPLYHAYYSICEIKRGGMGRSCPTNAEK